MILPAAPIGEGIIHLAKDKYIVTEDWAVCRECGTVILPTDSLQAVVDHPCISMAHCAWCDQEIPQDGGYTVSSGKVEHLICDQCQVSEARPERYW